MNALNPKSILIPLVEGEAIDQSQMEAMFELILSGDMAKEHIAAFLTALHMRGERVQDMIAGAKVMRQHMKKIELAPTLLSQAMDCCGTGGDSHDGQSTLNISTAVALVVSCCDVIIAKHGNRAQSSQSGAADILLALGINLNHDNIARSLQDIHIGFMFAQNHHPAMRHAAPVRQALGFPTIFNLLGPLCNPAQVQKQLLGVFDRKWLRPMAEALDQLGTKMAWVICGSDGLDELTLSGASYVVQLKNHHITEFEIHPSMADIATAPIEAFRGGDSHYNVKQFQLLLQGEKGAYRDIVLLNSAAALLVAGKCQDLKQGVEIARHALDEKARHKLQQWIDISNE